MENIGVFLSTFITATCSLAIITIFLFFQVFSVLLSTKYSASSFTIGCRPLCDKLLCNFCTSFRFRFLLLAFCAGKPLGDAGAIYKKTVA